MPTTRLLLFFLFLQQLLVAQQFSYKNIIAADGLPSSEVYDILQDKKGYMWFATNHGVARYNGKEFTNYTTEDGLLDNTVFRMCEDSKGRIWFVSQSNEVCYCENGIIKKAPISGILHHKLRSADVIRRFYIDASDNLWFNSSEGAFLSEAKNDYTTLNTIDCFKEICMSIKIVEHAAVMVLTPRWKSYKTNSDKPYKMKFGIQFNKDLIYNDVEVNNKIYPYIVPPSVSFAYSKNGTIFHSADSSLFIIRAGEKILTKILKHRVVHLAVDKDNNLWINYDGKGADCFKNCDINSKPISILDGCTPDDEYIDHEGGLWIATLEKGVFYIPSTFIFNYTNGPLLNKRIIHIGDWNNKIIVSNFSNMVYEERDNNFSPIDFLCDYGRIEGNLYTLKTIRDTTYASYSNHLERFTAESKTKSINKYRSNWFGSGKDFFEGPDHTLWLVTGGSLSKVNTRTENVELLSAPFRITCTISDGKNIFVGGKKGLYLFKDKKFISLSYKDSLLKSQIAQMTIDRYGNLWLATAGRGLFEFKNNKVIRFNKKDGLISNVCTAVAIDAYQNVWVGTNNGLSCIRQTTKEKEGWIVKNLSTLNGLYSNEITQLFAYGNSLWIGTLEGLSRIDIQAAMQPITPPPIYISSIKVNDSLIATQRTFPYNKNNLKFTLDPLTFKEKNHLYRYRLVGLNNVWQETKTDEILFNTLPPGHYTFEAQVANLDKIWSNKSATYSFTINKPFWFTWWFILIEILIACFIVYLIILWRTTIIRKKEQEKLRINKLLAEYQMKALTAQMNPHFIFNAINSIQNFIIQNHSTLAYDYLIKFSKLIRLVLNNSKENEISLKQELETLAIYVELEQLRFENSFDYHVNIASELDTDALVIPALLLQPYIENAIWHGLMPLKNRKGSITLTIMEQDMFLKITITDNGVGRKASDLIKKKIVHKNHQSIGMELTGKRIEVFGQESKFSLQIIDNYDDGNNSTGTTVEIVLPMIEMY
jgi:ligand-binding sensor domain-containing protein